MGLQFSFLLSAVLFGPHTNGHHFMAMVPLSYAGLAAAIGAFANTPALLRAPVRVAAAAILAILLTINIFGNIREVEALRRTGGVAMFSDAINRFATGFDFLWWIGQELIDSISGDRAGIDRNRSV